MKFSYNARIIKHLGYELITSDEVAITELIKNSYDAKATVVNIQFLSSISLLINTKGLQPIPQKIFDLLNNIKPFGIIVLEDNGKGMDYNTLTEGFFEVGSTLKVDEKVKAGESDPIILGDKGIGRLAAQRISPVLLVETKIEGSNEINIVQVEWDDFFKSKEAEAPEFKIESPLKNSYTRLWLLGSAKRPLIFNKFFEEKETYDFDIFNNPVKSLGKKLFVNDELHAALGFLYSPFESNKSVLTLNLSYNNRPIIFEFNQGAINIAESIHLMDSRILYDEEGNPDDLEITLTMQIKPWFLERIHFAELGKVLYQDWKQPHEFYATLLEKYKDYYDKSLKEIFTLSSVFNKWNKKYNSNLTDEFIPALLKLSPIEGRIYSFKRDKSLISMAIASAIDNHFIDKNSDGIKTDFSSYLSTNNGIKLYRNSFRIGTIGNKDNDWLKLQQKRTTGQQFYRFELGNVIGFIKINDKKQEYIYETSSREDLNDNVYVHSLQIALSEIIEIFSPGFIKRAVEITKFILENEDLIPENNTEEIEDEVNKSRLIVEAAKRNMQAINAAITSIKGNIDLDNETKINAVRKVFLELEPIALDFEQNIADTNRSFLSANTLLEVAKQQQIRIKTEAYNNYKLMANGLVTEVITHELHSLLTYSEDEEEKYDTHLKALQQYLLDNRLYDLNNDHLIPVQKKFKHLYSRMGDLDKFYSFLERTFIYKGNSEDFVPVNLADELKAIFERFKFRLVKHKIDVDISSVTNLWEVPKGSLMHVFYNLIDNSIYWIDRRQNLAKTNSTYARAEKDEIVIRTVNANTVQYFDTGTGVFEKYQHTLFNEMESGKENGRGMGLYIVRQFLKSFGGEIELLDALNDHGNRYIFEIRMKNSLEEDDE
ncbi:ATP-binding protein [Mucilaginibacter sp. BT774]|uniref:ATP-binding protein n=1 Tax=Mucilaginibacter sp. BT774 TaxID=3062276 RepID=UPI002675C26E|nr:ATP-binding protein [Mucilaginibacter sp. BT774]MDO3627600.1 ATP-binding protein [Mucilaginibacter sp. BT774]